MCGISGVIANRGATRTGVDAVLLGDSLRHRGRSGRGSYSGPQVSLGFDDNFLYADWITGTWAQFSDVIAQGPLVKQGMLRDGVLHRLSRLDWRSQWRLFTLSAWSTR